LPDGVFRDTRPENAMRRRSLSRLPLAAACLLYFAASAETASAAPLPVSNCNDAGAGSLRASIASAATGDTITIPSDLGCSKISLTTGALAVTQDDLSVSGPAGFTITGKYTNSMGQSSNEHDRIFVHSGTGTLELDGLTMSKGYLITSGGNAAKGGCVYSGGTLKVTNSIVSFCTAKSENAYSAGGGIFARRGLSLEHSTVSFNLADSVAASSQGGGLAAEDYLISKYNTIEFNTAGNTTTGKGSFGGFLVVHNSLPSTSVYNVIGYTTISNNKASQTVGGGGVFGDVSSLIDNVTVASNSTPGDVGGLYLRGYRTSVTNSTIAFNSSGASSITSGMQFIGSDPGAEAGLYSTIVSNNYVGSSAGTDVNATDVTIVGANDLVYNPNAAMPAGTLIGACPLLAPLDDYGGEMQTIKLLGRSPAIDHGSNLLNLTDDGRGTGFARSSGPPNGTAVPDIGAYEVNRSDEIFDNTFDAGCPLLLR
jgi:hypothetical protein